MSSEQISATPPPAGPSCPHCGARVRTPAAKCCWLCQESLAPGEKSDTAAGQDLAESIRLPEPRGDNPAWAVFGVLAILISLGLMVEAPGVLVVLLIVATPAVIRTVLAASREQGAAPGGLGAVGTFLSSLGIVAIVGLASIAAFYATCFVVCLGGLAIQDMRGGRSYDWILVASIGAGLIPGLAVAYYLFRRLWPRRS